MYQNLSWYEYSLDFNKPQLVNKKLIMNRKGLILSAENNKFLAEASPLPGYSLEDLDQVKNEIRHFNVCSFSLKNTIEYLENSPLSSSLKFALFTLFLPPSIIKKDRFFPISRTYIDVPSFHSDWKDSIIKKIATSLTNKNPFIKIKMSSYTFDETVEILITLKKLYAHKIKLHLDFNQVLSFDQANNLFSKTQKGDFFLIEDPVKDIEDLHKLAKTFFLPIAVDQALRENNWHDLKEIKNLKCMMIKPTLSMDLLLNKAFLEFIKNADIAVDLSSSYESPIGINCIKKLGHHFFKRFSLGIDTLNLFKPSCLKAYNKDIISLKKL
jgi:O-succinylbenzoate synthase